MSALRVVALILALACGVARAEPLRIAVISDMNGAYGSVDYTDTVSGAVARIIALRPDLVISTGDMVAGQRREPTFTTPKLQTMWAGFRTAVSDQLARAGLPLLVTPGNHDASAYPGFEAERAAFAAEWADRKPELTLIDGEGWPFRVAASVRGVLLVGIDATRVGPLAPDDMEWLRRILAAEAGRHRTVVLFGHLPLMAFTEGRERDVLADPALFELARASGVDLWLSGHHHAHYAGRAGGVLFVAQGALGGGTRRLIGEAAPSPRSWTLIEIDDAGEIAVSAFAAPGFDAALDPDALPPILGEGVFRLTRWDRPRD